MRFRKKPIVIEAIQFNAPMSVHALQKFMPNGEFSYEGSFDNAAVVHIHTLEGQMEVSNGDWIIKGVKGEFYPCKPDIFEASYDPAP